MPSDNEYRNQTTCAGCGRQKDIGLVVCWDCFKYRQDVTPFKYFDGYIEDWLLTLTERRDDDRTLRTLSPPCTR